MAKPLADEISGQYCDFCADIDAEIDSARAHYEAQSEKLITCFVSGTSIQAWRKFIVDKSADGGASSFLDEALNDFIVSLSLGKVGMWRASQQCLRGAIEGAMNFAYFKDHSVELSKWQSGYKPAMSELFEYLRSHPSLNADDKIGGTDLLHSQYSELCFSVHGSRTSHRMTRFGFPSIAVIDRQAEGQYETAFRKVVRGCNLVFLQLFQDRVRGPGNKHLKDHVALVLTIKQKAAIKTALKITVG